MSASRPELETRLWYEERIRRFGYDHRGLGFRSRLAQQRRFEALLALGAFEGQRLLDVGCGFGDLLAFLVERGIHPIYTGLDICAPMVFHCRQRFRSAGRFLVGDVLEHQPKSEYDFVVASGLFGLLAEGARERVRPTLEKLFGWCTIGLSVNFLSGRSPRPIDGRLYVEPEEALQWALAMTPAVRLDHAYLPNDFTLHLYRTPSWQASIGADAEAA